MNNWKRILRQLCIAHGLADENGNRLLDLKPQFASPLNRRPWTKKAMDNALSEVLSERLADRNAEILALHQAGLPWRYIAERFGISVAHCQYVCRHRQRRRAAAAGGGAS